MRVLVALDREADRRLVVRALAGRHRTEVHARAAEARAALVADPPDAVVLDRRNLGRLAPALRAAGRPARGPAVLLVAGPRDRAAAGMLRDAADDLVRRPLDGAEVLARLGALGRRVRPRWDSGERLRLALAAGRVGVWEWRVERGVVTCWRPGDAASPDVVVLALDDVIQRLHPDDRVRVADAMAAAGSAGRAFEVEVRQRVDGEERWLALRGRPRRAAAGRVTAVVGLVQDVTDRRRLQAAQESSEERLRALIEHSAEVIALLDADGRLVYASRLPRGAGGVAAGVPGTDWSSWLHPDDVERATAVFAQALAHPAQPFTVTVRVAARDGSWAWMEATVRNLLAQPHVRAVVVNARDVTARREAEAALRVAELRQRRVAEVTSDFAFTLHVDETGSTRLDWVSDAFPRITGYTLAEVQAGHGLEDVVWHPGDRHLYTRALRRVLAGESVMLEARARRPDGETYWLRTYARPLREADGGPVAGVYGAAHDVTDVRRLADERQRLASVVDATTDFVALADTSAHVLYLNRAARRALGVAPEADPSSLPTLFDCHPPWAAERLRAEALPAATAGEHWQGQLAWRAADGTEIPVSQVVLVHRGDSGRVEYVAVVARDIREHRELEQALRRQAAQLAEQAHVLDLAHLLIRDRQGVVRFWNRGAEQLYGWSADEAIGRPAHELLHTELPAPPAEIARALDASGHWEGKLVQTTRDGRRLVVASHWVLQRDADGVPTATLEVNNDITALERLRDDLAASREELRALSAHLQEALEEERTRIAREIHDELGQSLTGLKMDLAWLAHRLEREREGGAAPLLDKVRSMSEIVDGAVRAVRRTATALRPLVLDDLGLVAALEWQAQEFSARTGIRCTLRAHDPARRFDRTVATALFRIAQEALTNVARHAQASEVTIALDEVDGRLVLTVGDDGRGIAAGARTRGGLGLLGMEERARLLGGTVAVTRGPEGGTRVVATVPAACEVPAVRFGQPDSPSTSRMA